MEWIKIEDRLPERGVQVLVSNGESVGTCKLAYNHDYWIVAASNDICTFSDVTHWMPRPDPPVL